LPWRWPPRVPRHTPGPFGTATLAEIIRSTTRIRSRAATARHRDTATVRMRADAAQHAGRRQARRRWRGPILVGGGSEGSGERSMSCRVRDAGVASRKAQRGPAAPSNADCQWKMAQGSKPLRRSSTTRGAKPRPAPPPWSVTPPGRQPSRRRPTGGRRRRPVPLAPRRASRSRR